MAWSSTEFEYRQTMVPEADVDRVRRWATTRYPVRLQNEMKAEIEVAESEITVYECRPPWRPDGVLAWTRQPVVRFRRSEPTGDWSVMWRDSLDRLHPYSPAAPSPRLADLLADVDADVSGVFWG